MRQLATDLGIADYVTFTGRVPDAELLEMLNTADICVNPDRANEHERPLHDEQGHGVHGVGQALVQFDLDRGPGVGG